MLIPLRTKSFVRAFLLVLAILMYSLPRSRAVDNSSARRKTDNSTAQAMSVLRVNCLKNCHNDEKKKGGLRLTSRENALKGSDNGPVLVPRKSDKSLLTKVLLADSDPHIYRRKNSFRKRRSRCGNGLMLAQSGMRTRSRMPRPIPGRFNWGPSRVLTNPYWHWH